MKRQINRSPWLIIILISVFFMTGCSAEPDSSPNVSPQGEQPTTEPSGPTDAVDKLLQSKIERDLNPTIDAEDLNAVVSGNSTYAWDFYQQVRAQEGNLFYSPYSQSVALAMVYAGARSNTEAQIAQALRFGLPQDQLHPAFNALDLALNPNDLQDAGSAGKELFQLEIANAIWGQQGYEFLEPFLDRLSLNYGAGLQLVDFIQAAEPARLEINQWVADKTADRIRDLIPQGAVNDLTRLVLVNAIYFKADWIFTFNKNLTQEAPFYPLNGDQVNVQMMSHNDPENLRYVSGDGFQAVELPYMGDQFRMVVVVPDEGNFEDFEASMSAEKAGEIVAGLTMQNVRLYMPKFSFTSTFDLKRTLAAMGMPDAFDKEKADFSGIDGSDKLFITDVFHKAFVSVDEEGTEAAAATAVIVGLEMAMQTDVELTIDRPFLFFIRDRQSGSILFVGRVLNPAE